MNLLMIWLTQIDSTQPELKFYKTYSKSFIYKFLQIQCKYIFSIKENEKIRMNTIKSDTKYNVTKYIDSIKLWVVRRETPLNYIRVKYIFLILILLEK